MTQGPGGPRAWRAVGWAVMVSGLAGVAALGALWHRDRSRGWDTPRWESSAFVLLREGSTGTARFEEHWVVAVNLTCPHCRENLAAARERGRRRSPPVRIGALIVDTPRRPTDASIRGLEADQVWWDAGGAWRRRWGHRVYGEVLVFDASGTHLRTLPPPSVFAADSFPALGVPPDDQ